MKVVAFAAVLLQASQASAAAFQTAAPSLSLFGTGARGRKAATALAAEIRAPSDKSEGRCGHSFLPTVCEQHVSEQLTRMMEEKEIVRRNETKST